MTEYIERESVLNALSVFDDHDNGNEHFLYGIETARELVESMRAADVQSVKHGRWISDCCSNCGISKYNFISFNIVGEKEYARPFGTWLYCPRCGAQMEAGDEK